MANIKAVEDRMNDRLVVNVTNEFKKEYLAMCTALKVNPSKQIRVCMEADLMLWKQGK